MIVRVVDLVFLFVVLVRSPRGKSIADIIISRYGEAYIRKIRRFEKRDFKLRKSHLDQRFLLDFNENVVILSFLRFKLSNKHLKNSHVCKKCQIRLLEQEIKSKRKRINAFEINTQWQYTPYCQKQKLPNLSKISSNNNFSES